MDTVPNPTPSQSGDFSKIPALDLRGIDKEQLMAAMPALTTEQEAAVRMMLANIILGAQQNTTAKQQLALVLSSVTSLARSIGMVLTIA